MTEVGRMIVYRPPSHAKNPFGMYFKTPSYEKGEFPPQLKPYAGQIAHCPRECKGKKGEMYRMCLKKCAASVARHRRSVSEITTA